ncbi:MAG: hypothetical protein ABFD62_07950 [Syntrophaceae bacterium]
MRKLTVVAISLFILSSLTPLAFAQGVKCVNTDGEAAIVNGDIPSAKMEAVARAKWSAIEKVVGVTVKAGSMVQNFVLFDDAIKSETTGVVRSYEVLNQKSEKDLLHVDVKACVEPAKAQKAVSALSLNNQLAVFIPARKPRETGGRGEYEENNVLSETLIGKLIDQGYQVIDIASTKMADAATIERAVATGNTANLRSMLYKSLSNLLIIGKVDYTISTRKGQDIGYGISMPFNNVTVRLNYRIVAKNSKTGNTEILASGVEQGRALANTVEDAVANAMRDVAENFAPTLIDKISKYVQGSMKKVSVSVAGISDLDTNMETKNILQNIVWVAGVEEQSMGRFIVNYPENTLYLANSIKQKGKYKVVNFSQYSIALELEK